jgi:GAF domain-containing protein/PilZ domain-containing protein/Sel1 repeat-containing protein
MAVSTPPLRSLTPNRRRRLRHRTQSPAYLSFDGGSQSALLELHEIVNICEDGVAIQCHSPLEPGRSMSLCLDLAGGAEQIYTTGQVVWSTPAGRAGLRFTELPPAPLFILREWLFQNAMAGAEETGPGVPPGPHVPATPGYTDTLAAVIAVQREVEALGPDLAGALRLIATRTQILLRASGAALALSASDPDVMECRASSGPDAPPVGAKLQVGSGFSGECVKTGRLLRCDDTELDSRVDRESCRALGIRAILAAPVRVGTKSIGLVEVFSQKPSAFTESDNRVVQRLAETVLAAVNRAARAENLPPVAPPPAEPRFAPSPGSVLFATPEEIEEAVREETDKEKGPSGHGISLPRSYLIILTILSAAIFGALGYRLAPWIQSEVSPWVYARLHLRGRAQLPTVLASSSARPSDAFSVETATPQQLEQMAQQGNADAENALGLLYFQGDKESGIKPDQRAGVQWFERAAEDGNLAAQARLGLMYSSGDVVPRDVNRAYFFAVLARARGDESSKYLVTQLSPRLTRAQANAIEQQANSWLQQHSVPLKPSAGK